jgi:hypothetical protein
MARRRSHQAEEPQPIDQMGRRPWWAEPMSAEREAAHERAACLVSKGYGAVQWGRHCGSSTGSLFDDY